MACSASPQRCRAEHIAPKLRDAKQDGGDWEAKCPICGHPSFRVSKPDRSGYRNIYTCACKRCRCKPKLRAAVLGAGVLPGCLGSYGASGGQASPDPAAVAVLTQSIDDILNAPGLRPSDMRIILAEARGQKVPTERKPFIPWAMSIGIGRRQAYEAAERWCRPAGSSPPLPGEGVADAKS